MKQANTDVRQAAKAAKIPLWQIAARLPMHDAAFSRKLRFELLPNEKERVFTIIRELQQEAEHEESSVFGVEAGVQ